MANRTDCGRRSSFPYPCLTGLSASYFAVRPHRNRWRTRSHQLGRRLRPTLRQSHTLPLRTPAPAASSFCSRQPTHTAPLSASTTGHRRYACSWPLAVLVNSLSNDSVSRTAKIEHGVVIGSLGQSSGDVVKIAVDGSQGQYVFCINMNKSVELYDRGEQKTVWRSYLP